MHELTEEQKEKVEKILQNENDEKRLIELKLYLSTCREQLTSDYAHVAYQIWLANGGHIKNK